MPSLSKSKQLSVRLPIRLIPLSFGIIAALGCSSMLTACGGGGSGTTRTPGDGTTTPVEEKTYALKVHSQVALKNATLKLIDAQTKKEIATKTIIDGSDFNFDIKESDASGRFLVAELTSQGTYYDPTLNRWAPITSVLHSTFPMINVGISVQINPFTEITYQRALVRAGSMNVNTPDTSLLSVSSLTPALNETFTTFGVNSNFLTLSIAQQADLSKLLYDTTNLENPPNNADQYFYTFMSMGHYMVQKNENSADPSPYLTFAKRAAEDMRDGSLDGYTIVGDGTDGTTNSNRLINPIVANVKENTFPEVAFNTREYITNYQQSARIDYGTRLKNKGVLSFLAMLPQKDPAGLAFFQSFNFVEGTSTSRVIGSNIELHSYGAGNYKRAFGINPFILKVGDSTLLYNSHCQTTNQNNTDEGATDLTIYQDCSLGLNADENDGDFNAIEPLVGKYTSTDGCQLSITFDGKVNLTKGAQSISTSVNRDQSDDLIRLTPNTQSYIMNITNASTTPTEFTQFRMEKHKILSVVAGATNAEHPTSLMPSEQKFSCNFS